MKLKTDYSVSITFEDAGQLLSKFVEKKTGKKVIEATANDDKTFVFKLQGDESDLDQKTN